MRPRGAISETVRSNVGSPCVSNHSCIPPCGTAQKGTDLVVELRRPVMDREVGPELLHRSIVSGRPAVAMTCATSRFGKLNHSGTNSTRTAIHKDNFAHFNSLSRNSPR